MLQRLKNVTAKTKKKVVALATTAALTIGSAMTAMASETTTTVSASEAMRTALENGLNQMVTDFIGYVALVLPIGLTVFGAVWGTKRAKSYFASVAK